jgi:hypothetical protein
MNTNGHALSGLILTVKTLRDYHDIYLKTDVLLLADVFQSFRSMAFETYKLDVLHYRTLPSFSWDALLKLSQVELDLISDPRDIFISRKLDQRWHLNNKLPICAIKPPWT